MIIHGSVDDRIARNVIIPIGMERKTHADIVGARHKIERLPIAFAKRDISWRNRQNPLPVGLRAVFDDRIGKNCYRMDWRT